MDDAGLESHHRLADLVADTRLNELNDYWRGKRNGRRCPARRDLDPMEMARLLPIKISPTWCSSPAM